MIKASKSMVKCPPKSHRIINRVLAATSATALACGDFSRVEARSKPGLGDEATYIWYHLQPFGVRYFFRGMGKKLGEPKGWVDIFGVNIEHPSWQKSVGVSTHGGTPIAGWFLLGKIPSRSGWFRGTLISGNHHVENHSADFFLEPIKTGWWWNQ